MRVDTERERRIGVPKLIRHPPDAFPSGQGMARPGVPGVVEPERTYSLRLGSAAESQPNPGDIAAFNNFGLHRGRYHFDRSRRTVMVTYHKASQPLGDRVTFQQWFLEPGYLESLNPATRLFFEGYVQATWHRPHTSLK